MKIIGTVILGRDADTRYLPDGKPVMNFSAAFNHGKRDGEGKRPSQWVDFAMFGERVDKLVGHMLKGTRVLVYASDPRIETYTDRDGQTRAKMVARVDDIEFVSPPKDKSSGDGHVGGSNPARYETGKPEQKAGQAPMAASKYDDFEDDIPF